MAWKTRLLLNKKFSLGKDRNTADATAEKKPNGVRFTGKVTERAKTVAARGNPWLNVQKIGIA